MRWQAVAALVHAWLSGFALTMTLVLRPLPWWIVSFGVVLAAMLAFAAYAWQRDAL